MQDKKQEKREHERREIEQKIAMAADEVERDLHRSELEEWKRNQEETR